MKYGLLAKGPASSMKGTSGPVTLEMAARRAVVLSEGAIRSKVSGQWGLRPRGGAHASLWLEGNAAPEIAARRGDAALMIDQGDTNQFDLPSFIW